MLAKPLSSRSNSLFFLLYYFHGMSSAIVVNSCFLENLPTEILHEIFSHISLQDPIQWALTCKEWRNKLLLEYPGMWYEIDFRQLPNGHLLDKQLFDKSLHKIALSFDTMYIFDEVDPFELNCPRGIILKNRSNYIRKLELNIGMCFSLFAAPRSTVQTLAQICHPYINALL